MSTPADDRDRATRAEGGRTTPGERGGEPTPKASGPEALLGEVLSGRYLIERLIGEGGMGAVYQAEHTHMRKRMAVKVLHPEMSRMAEVVARFEREAMAAAHIDHPNVAAATDFGKLDDGSFFLVLEYVEGKSLREALARGRLELGRALHVARQTASALARAHVLGIVHRDLKPENIMLVARDGDPDFVKVLDFGIAKVPVGELTGEAKASGQVLTQLGMVYGTPEYMAPEQALGQPVDPRADLYALGVMTFEMIVGVRPYDHRSKVTLLGMHVAAPVPSMAERAPDANVPAEVDAIVRRLLAKEAAARFVGARELVETLDATVMQLVAQGRIAEPLGPMSIHRASVVSHPDASGRSLAMAVAPTGLARPAVSAPMAALTRARSALTTARAGLVTARNALERTLRGAPPWVSPKVIGASFVGLLLVLLVANLVTAGPHSPKVAKATAIAQTKRPPTYPPDPKVDHVLSDAKVNVDRGNFATAIDELTPLEKASPDRSDVHAFLERAYMGAHNTNAGLKEAGFWLAADPTAATDVKLEEDVRNAALVREVQDDAFALLESQMGATGVDLLYDIAYGVSGRLYPQAAARAKRLLELGEVRDRASLPLKVALDLHEAKTCEQKREVLVAVKDHGDSRVLPVLEAMDGTRGCGFLGHGDCYPCLRRDHLLADAIRAVEDRTPPAK